MFGVEDAFMEDKIKNQIDIINNKIKELNSLYHIAANRSVQRRNIHNRI